MLKNNEKGSTLVMVLLIAVIITILGASLFAMNMSASKQFTNKEEQVQARHLAEMGVMHYKADVDDKVRDYNETFEPEYNWDSNGNRYINEEASKRKYYKGLCKAINTVALPIQQEEIGSYEVKRINICNENIPEIPNKLSVSLSSTGETNNTPKEIVAEVLVKSGDVGSQDGHGSGSGIGGGKHQPPAGDDVYYKDGDLKIGQSNDLKRVEGGYVPFKSNLHIAGNLDAIPGNNKDTNLTVEKDLYVEKSFVMNNHACIVVKGDLTVLGELPKNLNAGIYIVVFGDAYFGKAPDKINSGGIFVKGNITGGNLGDKGRYKTPLDNCGNTHSIPSSLDFNWQVQSEVNPLYVK